LTGNYLTNNINLRDITTSDLPILFEHQLDPEATVMAAFPSRDRDTFMAHWKKIMAYENNLIKTISYDGEVAGYILSWEMEGEREVGYWLGKEYWGKGIATQALTEYISIVNLRPLFAHVAKRNNGSRRVLEKCGFKVVGEDKYVNIGDEEVKELVLKLE
jgi:RimJ/RimL family protein N-acetyltransferase